jgi:hypothetical protein
MIIIDPIKNEENFSFSTSITFPRTTTITHGVYDNKVDMANMISLISRNIKERNQTNVKGGKTDWQFFNDKPELDRFINYLVRKHKNSCELFSEENWKVNNIHVSAWGNEIKKGEYVDLHIHECYHLILYLTEGSPLVLPELKIQIKPMVGSYYIFEPYIKHCVPPSESDRNRYNLVVNIEKRPNWDNKNLIENSLKRKNQG